MPTRIAETFAAVKAKNRMAFMPFVTAGDPDLNTTLELIRELARQGVDQIEVGFPYSDPIADGPVIQASYTRALARHIHIDDIFTAFRALTAERSEIGDQKSEVPSEQSIIPHSALSTQHSALPPLVAMVSYAIVFRIGPERFTDRAAEAGFSGMIVPDLPGDEAMELAEIVRSRGLDLVQLVAPTTPPGRAERILKAASGFVYCISVAGTTGERRELPPALREQLKWLRTRTDLPLAVGFGISRPEQVDALRGYADGVIVGSGIVRQLEPLSNGSVPREKVIADIGQFAAQMVAATRG